MLVAKEVTLKQVAAAKVSRATAAWALNSYGYVGDEKRVLEAADSLGYRANRIAQALRRGRLPIIGFLPGDIQNPFFARLRLVSASERKKAPLFRRFDGKLAGELIERNLWQLGASLP